MTVSIKALWKLSANTVGRAAPATKNSTVTDHQAAAVTTPVAGKARAQVGTSVVEERLPMSGELRSSGSHPVVSVSSHNEHSVYPVRPNIPRERISPIHVRYQTQEQANYVRRKAREAGLSINSFICSATLDHLYVPPYDVGIIDELRQAKRQLIGIGINLNQLMHRVNAVGSADPMLDYIDAVRNPVLETIRVIRKALGRRTDGPMP